MRTKKTMTEATRAKEQIKTIPRVLRERRRRRFLGGMIMG
jgi:hypothetical protein